MKNINRQEQAINLYHQGYKIIPLIGKRPIMKGWQHYHKIKRTDAEIKNAFIGANNIGLVTGRESGITVIDIDYWKTDDSGNRIRKFKTTLEEFLKLYPTDVIVETGTGNHHLYYKYNPEIRTGTEIDELFGADVRNDGGQIVFASSVHPDTGKEYKFIRAGMYGNINAKIDYQKSTSNNTDGAWLTTIMEGVGKGMRDDACTKLAGYYHSKGMPLDVIRSILLDWNQKNKPPMTRQQVEKVIGSVTRYQVKEDDYKKNNKPAEKASMTMMDFTNFMTTYSDYTINWAIDEWLPSRTILFMVSPPQSFKTWLLLDLAISVAGGFDFMGKFKVNEKGPVLVFQQEDPHGLLVQRMATILQSKVDLNEGELFMPELPIHVQTSRDLTFDNDDKVREFEDLIKKYKPKLVLIDPLYSAIPIDDYMSKGAEYMFPLKTMRDKYGCSFVLAHHSKKSTSDSIDRTDLWGSQFLNAFLESGWQIRKNGETSIKIKRHFKVSGAMKDLRANFDIYTEFPTRYSVTIDEITEETSRGYQRDTVIAYIKKIKHVTIEKISKKFDVHEDEVKRTLSALVMEGMLKESDGGIYVKLPKLEE